MPRFANLTGMQPCCEVYTPSQTVLYGRKVIGGCFYIIRPCWGPWFMYWRCLHSKNWKSGQGLAWLGTCILWHMAAFSAGNEHLLIASALSWLPSGYLSVPLCAWSHKVAKTRFPPHFTFWPKNRILGYPTTKGYQNIPPVGLKVALWLPFYPPWVWQVLCGRWSRIPERAGAGCPTKY